MFNGMSEISMTIRKLPVFYKQRDMFFFPPWAYGLPAWFLNIPITFIEVSIWTCLTYYEIGLDPNAGRYPLTNILLCHLSSTIITDQESLTQVREADALAHIYKPNIIRIIQIHRVRRQRHDCSKHIWLVHAAHAIRIRRICPCTKYEIKFKCSCLYLTLKLWAIFSSRVLDWKSQTV